MERVSKILLWFTAATVLAISVCVGAGVRQPFTPTGSIFDIIDTQQVQRMLEARRRLEAGIPEKYRNDLGESGGEPMVVSVPDPEESTEMPPPPSGDFRKILKSSKNALVITKKEYLKEDWCKTENFIQKIREPGCLPTTIINKFCYGQCNSFYIPRGPRRRDPEGRLAAAFKSCSYCKPKRVVWTIVTLRCPNLNQTIKRKRYQIIKQCKCLPVTLT